MNDESDSRKLAVRTDAVPGKAANVVNPAGAPVVLVSTELAGEPRFESWLSACRKRLFEQQNEGDFLTIDLVVILGRIGTDDARALKVNDRGPAELGVREHLLLVILAHYAKYVSVVRRNHLRPISWFLPANTIADIIDRATREGGLAIGRWPDPTGDDVYHAVNRIRKLQRGKLMNRNLIERGQKGAGYRLSTHTDNILIDASDDFSTGYWAKMFEWALLRGARAAGVPRRRD